MQQSCKKCEIEKRKGGDLLLDGDAGKETVQRSVRGSAEMRCGSLRGGRNCESGMFGAEDCESGGC